MCTHYLGGGEPPRPPETHLDGDLMGPWLLWSQPECRPVLMVSRRSSENWSRHAGSCLSSGFDMRAECVSATCPHHDEPRIQTTTEHGIYTNQTDRWRQDRVSDFKWVALAKSENFQQISITSKFPPPPPPIHNTEIMFTVSSHSKSDALPQCLSCFARANVLRFVKSRCID